MEDLCNKISETLKSPIKDDPIQQCGKPILTALRSNPSEAILLANEKLHVFPFHNVHECWKRLFTDASISKAIGIIRKHSSFPDDSNPKCAEKWITEVVRLLDMALIMTGGSRRETMIEELFTVLQQHVDDCSNSRKRKRIEDHHDLGAFPVDNYRSPEMDFPIRRSNLSVSEFESYLMESTPIVITGALCSWPAMQTGSWSKPCYLLSKTFNGRRLVPIEIGRSYTDPDFSQAILPFKQFLTNYLLNPNAPSISYLAQHDLFSQIPALRKDIRTPEFCFTSATAGTPEVKTPALQATPPSPKRPLVKAWLGPAGTISPLHTDPYHNILCQVVGRKYIRLYHPRETEKLYPHGVTEDGIDMSNTSRVGPEQVEMSDLEEDPFPQFAKAKYFETVLKEGECLYIPVGWWHYVRSLTVSFNVSFWWT